MQNFDRLRDYLKAGGSRVVALSFTDLDRLVDGLPPPAIEREQWWANDNERPEAQCRAWRAAGYRAHADRERRLVTFTRCPDFHEGVDFHEGN